MFAYNTQLPCSFERESRREKSTSYADINSSVFKLIQITRTCLKLVFLGLFSRKKTTTTQKTNTMKGLKTMQFTKNQYGMFSLLFPKSAFVFQKVFNNANVSFLKMRFFIFFCCCSNYYYRSFFFGACNIPHAYVCMTFVFFCLVPNIKPFLYVRFIDYLLYKIAK